MFEVTRILDHMEYFNKRPRPPLYWWAMEYLKENPVDADIFMAKGTEEDRLELLNHLNMEATMVASGQLDAFAPPPPWQVTD